MTITCPACNFTGANILATGERRCASCGHVWVQPFRYPPPPTTTYTPAKAGPRAGVFIFIGVVAAVVLAGVMVAALASSGFEHEPRPDPAITESDEQAAEPVLVAKAELGPDVAKGVLASQAWWLVEYKNTGEAAISFPQVKMTVTGTGPKFEKPFVSSVYSLPPRYSAWILCFAPSDYAEGEAAFEIVGPKPKTKYQDTFVPMKGENYRVDANPNPSLKNNPVVAGTLINDKNRELSVAMIIVVGFDEDNKPCAYASGYPKERKLPVDGKLDFAITAGYYQMKTPKRWIIHAWGHYKE